MPTHIASCDWTHPDARAIADPSERLDGAQRQLEEMGGRFAAFWTTMGEHDMPEATRYAAAAA